MQNEPVVLILILNASLPCFWQLFVAQAVFLLIRLYSTPYLYFSLPGRVTRNTNPVHFNTTLYAYFGQEKVVITIVEELFQKDWNTPSTKHIKRACYALSYLSYERPVDITKQVCGCLVKFLS